MVAEDVQPPESSSATESNPRARKRRRSWWGFFRDVFLYILIYIAVSAVSIGPLFWTWFGAVYCDGPKWIARIYLPLALVCEFCPPLSWLVNVWINWWIL